VKERRQFKRSPIELAASFGVSEDVLSIYEASLKNISGNGISFISDKHLNIGECIQLAITLDDKEQVVIDVDITWIDDKKAPKEYIYGVQVVKSDSSDFKRFLEFYNQLFKK